MGRQFEHGSGAVWIEARGADLADLAEIDGNAARSSAADVKSAARSTGEAYRRGQRGRQHRQERNAVGRQASGRVEQGHGKASKH